jgi:predicted ATPase
MARLDRLATVKSLAQLAATLGREFSYELLQAVSLWDEGTLQRGLHQLVEAELLYQQGLPPQATYLFKHALIQDTAYQSLLRSTRQQQHQRIAQVLEARFPEIIETQPELLAHHYTAAGLAAQAIPYWQRAGQRANQRSAHVEAIGHLTQGLEVLKALPDTPERTQQELDLQTTLGPALMATRGNAAPEVGHAYARARELCQQVGETPQLFPVLVGLWRFYFVRAEHQTARELAEQCLGLAQRQHTPAFLLEAHRALGVTMCFTGEWTAAWPHLEQGMTLYHPHQHRSHALLYGRDPGMDCQIYLAWTLWMLGYPDQARTARPKALSLAEGVSHPLSMATALGLAACLCQFCQDVQAVRAQTEAVIALATAQGFPQWVAFGTILRGWALAMQGQTEEGIAQIRQGMAAWRATGSEVAWPLWLACLAEAYGKAGQAAAGLTALAEARALVPKTAERFWEAELHRLTGELLLAQEDTQEQEQKLEAVETWLQALEIARQQQAKSLELRAAMRLARLWQGQGKHAEARQLLAPIYDWFTEGFDTVDLREAKGLLEALP